MATLTPLVVSLFLLLTVIPAYAAVFSIASGNAMALIAAINAANANNDANAINLAAGTYSLTAIDNDSPNGRNGLAVITSTMTLNGQSAEATIIRASGAFRALEVGVNGKLSSALKIAVFSAAIIPLQSRVRL